MRKMKHKRKIALLLSLMMAASLFTGCGKTQEEPKADGAKTEQEVSVQAEKNAEPKEKELRIAVSETMGDFDASQGNGSTILLEIARLGETLVNVDNNFKLQPNLATDWEATDELTWVFNLRDDVTFHDGSKFNAEAVKWWLEKTRDNMPSFDTYTHIKSVDVLDEYKVQFNLSKPFSELPEALTNQCSMILSKNSFKDDGTFDTPIGTGYFRFESFDPGKSVLNLVPYDNYWAGKPDSSITRRVIRSIPDPSTRALAASNGEVDIAADVPFSELKALESDKNVRVEKFNTARTYIYSFNFDKEYLQDVNVRKALVYAINRQEIVDKILLGVGGVAKGPMMENVPWANLDAEMYDYDPEMAKNLLDEAGFVDSDNDGIREYKGQEVKLKIITDTYRPGNILIAQAVQGYYSQIGLDCEAQALDFNTVRAVTEEGDFDLTASSIASCYIPSASYYITQCYYTGLNTPKNARYSNPELDKLIDQCAAETDQAKKYELSKQVQALAMEDLSTFTMALYGAVFILNPNITGFDYSPAVHDFVVPITTDIAD